MADGTGRRVKHGFAIAGKVIGTLFLVGVLTLLIFLCIFAVYVKRDLASQTDFSMDGLSLDQTSVIYYYDSDSNEYKELQKLYGSENRIWASYDEIPSKLIYACVAIEDKRFFDHKGVDWLTTAKASVKLFLGTGSAGGSTITQQLIKNLTGREEVTVRRKLVEILRALEFEKEYSKDDIMEWYLNTIYLGEGCYGVKSAAEVYFGKQLSELTAAECASLIAITNNPSIYDPYINEEKNIERQRIILREMYDQGYLDGSQYQAALDQELVFTNTSGEDDDDSDSYYSYFVDQVIRDVVDDLMEKTGYDYNVVYQMVLSGGYTIYCTIDPDVQAAVDAVYTDLSNLPDTTSYQQLQSGIVIVDNDSGDIIAMAGGVGEKTGSLTYSRATQSTLSPGSCIKPLSVYAPALDLGIITPITVYDDTPVTFTDNNGELKSWPKNSDSTYRGLMTVTEALERSTNTIAVKLCEDVGVEYSYTFAKEQLGLSTLVSERTIGDTTYSDVGTASMALGGLTNGVTVRAMAAAYATFANSGVYREARTYTKVLDADKNVILDNTQEEHTAVKELTAWYLTDMMQSVVENGTGQAAQLDGFSVAGKTGTTTSDYDRWFCGYTPYYTAAVWVGYDDPEEIILTDTTENPAITLWRKVMELAHKGKASRSFTQPANVVECSYCADSGLLASTWCEQDVRGTRVRKAKLSLYDVPTATCTTHVAAEICDGSGHLANSYCAGVPDNTTHRVGMITVDRFFPIPGVTVADQQYNVNTTPPDGYYAPSSTTGDPMNLECYLHDETSIPEPEPDPEPEEEEPTGSETNSPGDTTEQPPDEPAQPETPSDTDTQD
jgi:penicillin-binding protein 1A